MSDDAASQPAPSGEPAPKTVTAEQLLATLTQQTEQAAAALAQAAVLHDAAVEASGRLTATVAQAQAILQTLQQNAEGIAAVKSAVDELQAAVATKSQYIEEGRIHAENVRSDLDIYLSRAEESAANSEARHQASLTSSQGALDVLALIQTTKMSADADAAAVANLRQQCDEHAATSKKLADIADTSEKSIAEYETRLAEFERTAAERLKTINTLLPGATSAGLAAAFDKRRKHFTNPQVFWQVIFLTAIGGLLSLAWYELTSAADEPGGWSWDRLSMSFLHRLPFALPLIWLAIHASRKSALAQQVQEDYAFKETVSRSFEGYRREMIDVSGKAEPGSVLARYCEGVLTVITNPPGRIYEKHALSHTPLNVLAESAGPIGDAAAKLPKPTANLNLLQ